MLFFCRLDGIRASPLPFPCWSWGEHALGKVSAGICVSIPVHEYLGSNRHRSSPSLPWDWGMLKYCREKLRECLRICVLFVSRVRRREGQRRKLELNLNQWQVEIRAVAQLTAASQGEAGEGLQLSKLGLLIGPQFCSMEM